MKVESRSKRSRLRLVFNSCVCIVGLGLSHVSLAVSNFAQNADGEMSSLAVMSSSDFVPDATGLPNSALPDALAARIMERLTVSKRFILLERTATRRLVLEQRFGRDKTTSDVDKVLEKAVDDMTDLSAATLAVAGYIASRNDGLKDFQDLGSVIGADYIVYAKLEKLDKNHQSFAQPFSDANRQVNQISIDARLYLRTINTRTGTIAGAASIRTKLTELQLTGQASQYDSFEVFDQLGLQAAAKIIDMVYPARIVSSEPFVLNRGSNDGVKLGDRYQIKRQGKVITDNNGVQLGRVENSVGSAELIQVQNTLSIMQMVSGELQVNDLAVASAPKQAQAPSAVPLNPSNKVNASSLPKLAIGLVKTGSTANTGASANQHMPAFTDTLISLISQTKRFQLIDRQEVDQLLNEQIAQALVSNQSLPSALGTLQGADYLLYGSVAKMGISEKQIKLPGSARVINSLQGYVEGNMRIVDARSGNILASRKISIKQNYPGDTDRSLAHVKLADSYGEQVVLNLMSAVYPIKVAATTADGSVYINRGSDGGLVEGETLTAYRSGQAIVDPDTGAQLGFAETTLGPVVLVEVENARAKGFSSTALQVGDLLKRQKQNRDKTASGMAANTAPKRSGASLSAAASGKTVTLAVGNIQVDSKGNTAALRNVNRVTDDLLVKLNNTRRFQLLERSQVDQLIDQKTFDSATGQQNINASLEQLVSADYLVYGTINEFYIQKKSTQIALLNETQHSNTGIIEANLRIVDVQSGKVIAADKLRVNKRLANNASQNQLANDLLDGFTTKMVSTLLTRLYPIKILAGSGERVFVNRGQDAGLKVGDQYLVLRQGEEMIDPDTGISFGFNETQIAKLELTRIESSRAQGRITSGKEVQKGDILRPVSKSANAGERRSRKKPIRKPSF